MKAPRLRSPQGRRHKARNRKDVPFFDQFEERCLLSTNGFIQGYVHDNSGDLLNGATVSLYTATPTPTFVTSTTSGPSNINPTNPNGYYAFSSVAPGTYDVVETQSNYSTAVGSIQTTINPAQVIDGNEIQVTVEDLSSPSASAVSIDWTTYATGALKVYVELNKSSNNSAGLNLYSEGGNNAPLNLTFTAQNTGTTVSNIVTYCTDLIDEISPNRTYNAVASLTPASTTLTTNIGELDYLYNTYVVFNPGSTNNNVTIPIPPGSDLTSNSAVNGNGLQLAMWALEYNQTGDLNLGDLDNPSEPFAVNNATGATAASIITAAKAYLADAAGKTEYAYFLDPNPASSVQGLITTDLLDFTNTPSPTATPQLTTQASPAVTLGATGAPTISDTATLSGYQPDGLSSNITFTLKQGTTTVYTTSDAVTGNGNYTASYTLPTTGAVTGTYTWSASYSGDADNAPANDQGGTAEQTVVSPASPTLITTASPAITLGTTGAPTISDSAALSGGYLPDGLASSIAFTLKLGTTTVYTTSDAVTGDGNYSASYTLPTSGTVTGTYTWSASYSGDADNGTASDQGGAAEQTVVSPASPTLITTASPAITLGTTAPTISDSAALSGGYLPDGLASSIAFTLKLGTTTVYTTSDAVTGDGNYSASYTLPTSGTVTGTYTWSASYSGDADNGTASDQGGTAEQTVVSPASPTLITTASPAITLGTTGAPTISDSAALSGGYLPDGLASSIAFTLKLGTTTVYTTSDAVSGDGNYSASYTLPTTGTVTGTYTWSASYSGDADNGTASDQGGAAEQTVVSPASPTLITTASPAITLGTTAPTISDSAALSGGYLPDGLASSIAFTLKLGTTTVYTTSDAVTGDGNYSASYTLPTSGTVTGTYTWSASYSGDADNGTASDQGGTAEQTVVSPASPTLITTASPAITLGTTGAPTISDSAALSGGYLPDGLASSIAFTLKLGTTTVYTTSDAVTGDGNYSASYTLPTTGTVTGTYTWSASYSGDADNGTASDQGGAAEQTVVSPASPTLITTASPAITLGTTAPTISDSAALSGGYLPDGLASSIAFTLKLGTTTVYTTSDAVTGDGNYSASYTLPTSGTVTGTYTWSASYSGDADNGTASDQGGTAEQTVVSPASPTLITTASPAITLGTTGAPTISDSAALSGGYLPDGLASSIAFTLKLGTTTVYTTSDAVSGDGNYSASYTLPTTGTVTGTYTWSASYSGDADNGTASDQGGAAEQTVVSPASPTLITTASPAITLGTTAPTISDSAALSGGYLPDGLASSIAFTLKLGTTTVYTTSDAVTGDGNYSASYTLPTSGTVTGTYTWSASYSGDADNGTASDQGGTAEQTVVSPASPTLITTASPAITLGTTGAPTISDSAALSGGYLPDGLASSIAFTLKLGTTTVYTTSDAVSGDGNYSASYTLPTTGTVTGTYTWSASYSGDADNGTAHDQGGAAEQTVVSPASPTLITTASPAVTLGTTAPTISDSAALSGGYLPDGLASSIAFTLKLGTTTVYTTSDAVTGDGNYSASYTLPTTGTVTGTYTWSASYSGDADNGTASDQGGAAEQTVVSPASPTLITTASPAITLGTTAPTISDSAALSGGYLPDGLASSIAFTLKLGTTTVYTTSDAVTGDGNYSASYTLPTTGTVTGTYTWSASYSGDADNGTASDQGGTAEQTVVSPASPTLITTASPAVTLGTTGAPTISDSAALSGGYLPDGLASSIAFTLKLGTTTVYTTSDAVTGDGNYSASYTLPTSGTVTGTYTWSASYSGDADNGTASDQGGAAEQTVVSPASPTLITTASPAITLGTTAPTISDSAALSGGYLPDGLASSIAFTLKLGTTTVYTTSDAVTGDGNYSASYTLPTTGTVTGTYTWSASYSGDADNGTASDQGGTAEQTVVSPASPTLITTASPAITLGTTGAPTISDSAALSGGYLPDGLASSIAFTLKLGTTTVYTTSDAVTGDGNYSASYTLPTSGTVTGTYTWSASYSGDADNGTASDQGGTAEQTVVSPASPTLITTASPAITLGTTAPTISDSAALSGGYLPDGLASSIAFTLKLGTTTVYTTSDAVTGDGNYSASYTLPTSGTVTGTYTWSASYSGDADNGTASDQGGAAEQTVVSPASPTLITTASPAITLGTTAPTISDSAALSGGYLPDGLASSIAFTLKLGTTTVYTTSDAVTGDGNYSASYTLPTSGTVTGTYTWSASYSGDADNGTASDQGGTAEQTVVSPASPTLITTASPAITLGTTGAPTISDSAALSGGYLPDGLASSIAFTLKLGTTTVYTTSDAVSGDGNYSASYTLPTSGTVTGTYTWSASYSGDADNGTASDQGGAAEQTVVSPASPTLITTASPAITLGSTAPTISDSAALSGGYLPDGLASSIAFTLKLGTTTVYTTSDAVSGDGNYSASYTLPTTGTVTGTYTWSASYSGDADNSTAHDQGGTAEQTVVSPASPTLITTASPAITLGTTAPTISDSAALSGGYLPDGLASSIAFTLKLGTTTVYTTSDAVSGDGNYSASYTLPTSGTVTGTYTWSASYSGDADNGTAHDQGGAAEQTVVSPASPTLITTASPAITLGTTAPTISDSAALSGGYLPDGLASSIAFTLKLGTTTVYTTSDAVTGDGNYSANYTLPTTGTVTGTYTWSASYSGDADNSTAHDQGGTAEQTVVSPAAPKLVTTAGGTVALGGITISGTKYLDLTGNGFSSDDTPLGGVTINLYMSTNGSSGLQTGSGGDELVATTTTASNGTYSFAVTTPGTYYVQESVPSGYLQTGGGPNGSAGTTYYTISAAAGHSYSGYNFDDFQTTTCNCGSSFNFTVTTPKGVVTHPTSLGGNTAQGDTVSVALPSGSSQVYTLVVYTAPGSSFSDSNAYLQQIYLQPATGSYTAGNHTLTVTIPNTYYQIDFVCGSAINELEPSQYSDEYGPDSANVLYTPQGRLITSDNGGTTAPSPLPTPTPTLPPVTSSSTPTTTLTDSAVLSGGYDPIGTIVFTLYNPSNTVVYTDTVTVSGNGTYSTGSGTIVGSAVPTVAGTYQWTAVYSGDTNNSGAHDQGGTSEQETVTGPASPTISTKPSTTSTQCSNSTVLTDTATLAGGNNPTGTIIFTLYSPSGTLVDTETVTVKGDGSYKTPNGYTLPTTGNVTGTYQWDATYSGDANNNSASDVNDAAEQITIGKASPSISTTPSTTSTQCSTSTVLKDTAALAGGDDPTGTITFTLYNPSGTLVDTETVTVNGDGSYATPKGYTLPTTGSVTGTYQWDAAYGGDTNNNAVSDVNDKAEQITIGKANLTLFTTPSPTIVQAGNCVTLNDTATLSGGFGETGTITFTLYSPSNKLLDTETVSVNGDGTYTTPKGYSLPSNAAVGVYQWDATYTGDGNNIAATDNNDTGEQVMVVSPCCNVTNLSFSVYNPTTGKTTTVSDLRGNTAQGDTVTASFNVPAGYYDQITLASYIAPQSYYSQTSAYLQQIYLQSTGTFGPGTHTLSVTLPCSDYQVDLVCGTAIAQLGLSPSDFYSAQNRLLSADNEGTSVPSSLSGSAVGADQTAATSFWTASNGQGLITSLNGGSSATSLGNWLATVSPNLFSGLAGDTNTQVAAYVKTLSGATAQVMATALSMYVTDSGLAGGTGASADGFKVTTTGSGIDSYNVGSNGTAIGLSNSTSYSLVTLLAYADSAASGGFTTAESNAVTAIFTAINTAGTIKNATLSDAGLAYTPAQIRAAYGINDLSEDGTGQTIAIVDAYDDPNIVASVDAFDGQFGLTDSGPTLYDQYGPASSFLTVVNESGQTSPLPSTDPSGAGTDNWEVEEALDVEWAHAMAPGAQIVLVEANSQSLSDLMAGVATAAAQPGVTAVTMSWGFPEGQSVFAADEANYDAVFNVPGVTFLASTGDYGTSDPEYPAFSPNVVAVGGTSLNLNADSSYNSETGWGYYSNSVGAAIGSGGGLSLYETEPSYQEGVQSTGSRTTPDVSMDADPATGAWIADSYNLDPSNPFEVVGGTSLSAPAFAGLVALVNQGREAAGEAVLNSASPTETQQALYSLPQADYNSITSGSNGYTANAGYNLVTGLGTPVANFMVPDLIDYQGPGTTYAGPTVSPLLDATLDGSWAGGGGGTTNAFNVFSALTMGSGGFAGQAPASAAGMPISGTPATVVASHAVTTTPMSAVTSTFGLATGHVSTDASPQAIGWATNSGTAGVLSQPGSGATIAPVSNGHATATLAWSAVQSSMSTPSTYGQPSGSSTTFGESSDVLIAARSRMGLVADSVLDELAADSSLWQRQQWDGTVTIPVLPSDSVPGVAVPTDPAVRQDPLRSPVAFAERLAIFGLAAGLFGGAGIVNARKRRSADPSLDRKPLPSRPNRD